jgi:hypothetical protein
LNWSLAKSGCEIVARATVCHELEFTGCNIERMAYFRDWFWQLEASRLGPDHFVTVRLLPNQAGVLLQLVRQFVPNSFVPEDDISGDSQPVGCQRFIDQRTYDTSKSMQESGVASNIYINSSIEICDGNLAIENTYARHEVGETAFLIDVFQAENIKVLEWRIFAGGSGYDSVEVARGDNAASFLEYLKPEIQ